MELHEFIKETLLQIKKGVSEAQEEIKGSGFYISPKGYTSGEAFLLNHNENYRHVQKVKMSIALTVDESKETKAGINVIATFLNAGASKKDGDTNSVTHRIEFEIPIIMNVMEVTN